MKKFKMQLQILCIVMLIFNSVLTIAAERPNIVIIMADDMGLDDISFRGSNQFITPNIDALAFSGVILKNLYTPSMCTPSRSALLTGKYPINTGMQHYVIANDQPWGLPTDETTMAQIFQENGYATSLIGKWHLGMSRKAYTPTMRGFDQHYGYLGAYIDYFDQTLYSPSKNFSRGHDFRENINVSKKRIGDYVTNVLTDSALDIIEKHNTSKSLFMILSHLAPHTGNEDKPLQAPEEEIKKFAYIKDTEKRTYAAMMSILDKSVGLVVDALSKKSILKNTIILFLSDNGGPTKGLHANTGSNYPLRGQKNSPWEGGIRSSAAIWSPQFEKLGTVWKQKIYIGDLLPTLTAAAGITLNSSLKLDGLNLWSSLKYGYESVEREIVHNIDEIFAYISYTKGKWKYVNGSTEAGKYDTWLGERSTSSFEVDPNALHYVELIQQSTVWQQLSAFNIKASTVNISKLRTEAAVTCQFAKSESGVVCKPLEAPCLFDIDDDPCEQNNLYETQKNTKIVQAMLERIDYFRKNAHAPNNKPSDPMCDPALYHNEWTWWQDVQDGNASARQLPYLSLLLFFVFIFAVIF